MNVLNLSRALFLSVLALPAPASATDWPQWRGPQRTGHSVGAKPPSALPQEVSPVWKSSVGGGFSGVTVAGGTVVYLDENGSREIAHALDAKTGTELWQLDYAE